MTVLRWGLIGCGDIARKRVAPALRDAEGGVLAAAARNNADAVEAFAREFGAEKAYGDWRELVADADIDAVYIATPVDLHAEQTIAAAEAGKHVLCEKPMALTVEECDRVIDACRAAGVKLGVAYYRRFYPVVARIRSLIEEGGIGKPVLAQVNAFEPFNPQPGEPRYWLMEKERSGGGPMADFGCHRIEVLLNLLGAVRAAAGFTDNIAIDRKVEDTSAAFLKFESGARATLTVSHAVWEAQDTLDVFGTEGSVHVPELNAGELIIRTGGGESRESHPPHANLHQPLIEDFIAAVAEDREPAVGGDVGRDVAWVEKAIYGD